MGAGWTRWWGDATLRREIEAWDRERERIRNDDIIKMNLAVYVMLFGSDEDDDGAGKLHSKR